MRSPVCSNCFRKESEKTMKMSKKFLLHLLFIAVAVTAMIGIAGNYGVSYAAAADTDDGVYFEEPYAAACDTLTVKYDGEETDITYRWYVNDDLISFNDDEKFGITQDHYEKTIRAEVWQGDVMLGETSMFCSKLPVLYIDTENGAEVVSKDKYIDAQIRVQGNDKYNAVNSTLYTGETEIKGRGNSTWSWFPKKPYKLKLDKKADLFGMGKNKHWVLLANYIDESGMRNMLAGDIATRMGVGAMDGTWVEVVMNGENLGLYMLCEHVRLSEDRVDVFDWESAAEDVAEAIAESNGFSADDTDALTDQMAEEDMSWISTGEVTYNGVTYKTVEYYEDLPDSFSGGYLLEMDYGYDEVSKFTTDNGAPIMFKSPEFIYTDETAMNTVKEYIQTFEDALYSKDFNTESEGRSVSYTELCDVDSFAGFWLASEILVNEVGFKSTYFQKDIDQPLVFGPVWDFDFSSGSVAPFGTQSATDWTSDNTWLTNDNVKWWVREAMKDPYFAVKVRNAFLEQEEYLKHVIADGGLLDEWYDYLKESGEYNYEIWQYSRGFEADYDALSSWLTERIQWMDKQFATNDSIMESMGITFSDKFSLELQGESVNAISDNAYTAEVGSQSYELTVTVNEGGYQELNYYINSKYQGQTAVSDGKAVIVIREDQLTEAVGDDNVITVWLKDSDGNLAEQQYMTVKLVSDSTYYNAVFNDMGGTYSSKVLKGEKVYLDKPVNYEAEYVFEGWNDGEVTHEAGKWLAVSGDVTLNAVWKACTDGGYIHDLKEDGDTAVCSRENCNASKKSENSYTDIAACTFTHSERYNNYYTGAAVAPVITITNGTETLVENVHYTIEYVNNIEPGYATYTARGIKEAGYTGEALLSYRIIPQKLSAVTVSVPAKCVFTGKAIEPAVVLTYNGMTLVEGTDYELTYKDNTKIGTGTVSITGKGNYTGSVSKTFEITAPVKSITKCTFTGGTGSKAYTGKAVKPVITVRDGSVKLVQDVHYTVKYTNNVKCGTATVTVTGKAENGYNGTKKMTFKIIPGKTTVKVTNVKYNLQKVTWTKVTGASKYKIYRSLDNKTYKHVKTVKASASRVYQSKSLEAGKTYYYIVRAVKEEKSGLKTITHWGFKSAAVKQKTVLYKGDITSVKNTAAGTATIKWVGVNGAHGYKIYRSTSKNGTYKFVKTVKNVKQYKDKKLKKGKKYYYKVKPYRKVDGKMVYGAVSKPVAVKIKR